ncbi:hypothetical protein Xish_00297 [Xenorhabdus ishibashii]|uniref:Arc-like DNA binding domain-containing protein n=2 Tax=Xenorhabdus ishibashii TaxID=1034471 RepID=A0A2D0KCZ0_9GAMM|nr:hypothetical protein Xish_00297 [Xenorhabdus ishibashii]
MPISDRPPQVNIRMPNDLRITLRMLAKIHGRSMNSEIVHALNKYASINGEALTTGNSQGFEIARVLGEN